MNPDSAGAIRAPGVATIRYPAIAFHAGLFGLALAALLAWLPALRPESLWLDDQWMAVLARDAPLSLLLGGNFPATPGFILALRATAGLFGYVEWSLQLLPLAAGLMTVVLGGLAARNLTGSRAAGFVAAALLAANPLVGVYSLRVKPFTLEALITSVLLLLAVAVVRSRSAGPFAALALAAAAALLLSFIAIFPGALLVNVLGMSRLRERQPGSLPSGSRSLSLAVLVAYNLWAAGIYTVFIRGRANGTIIEHWHRFFLPLDDPSAALSFLTGRGLNFFTQAWPEGLGFLAPLILLGLAALIRRKEHRPIGVALGMLYLAVPGLAALRLYPMGGGRTDLYAYPIAAILAAAALAWAGERRRWVPPLAAAAGAAYVVSAWTLMVPDYPASGARRIVEQANELVRDEDGLVVYPITNYAVGFYGRWPVLLEEGGDSTNGFYVHLVRPNTMILRESLGGPVFHQDRRVVERQLRPFLDASPPRLAFVAVAGPVEPREWIVEEIRSSGYELERAVKHEGAQLLIYQRAKAKRDGSGGISGAEAGLAGGVPPIMRPRDG